MSNPLNPTTALATRIADIYPSLSHGNRRAADFVLQNPIDVATMSIEKLAEGSGTSNATVTRFVRALGYANYGEFRAALTSALKVAMAPVDKLASARLVAASPFATFVNALSDQAANLQAAREGLDEAVATRAIEALLRARRIFLAGAGTSYHVASFLEDGLALYVEADVIFPAGRGDPQRAVRHLLSARPDDLIVAISTPRYMRSTLDLCRVAKKHGAALLALTDAPTSPLTPIADMTLFAPARNAVLPNSPTAIFALADALITAVARARPQAVEALKELSESRLWNYHP